MNRIVELELAGNKYPLNFSLSAAESFTERFGGLEKIADQFSKQTTVESMRNIKYMLAVLIREGLKYRKIQGETATEIPSFELLQEEIGTLLGIADIENLIPIIMGTFGKGSERTIETENNSKNAETTQG